jgi:hypothetical protein
MIKLICSLSILKRNIKINTPYRAKVVKTVKSLESGKAAGLARIYTKDFEVH